MIGISHWDLIVFLPLLMAYFVPVFLARSVKHPFFWPIFVINLCLGWTCFGWVGALVWAMIPPPRTKDVVPPPLPTEKQGRR